MQIPLLNDILIICLLSIGVIFLCHQIRIPVIVGFLLTGVLAGPDGLKLIRAVHEVESLAEIGVVLLLFTIGLEFSLSNLRKIKRSILLGGSLQVFLTVLAVFAITRSFGYAPGKAVFIGFLVSLSSTAIVLKLFQEKAEVEAPHGRATLAILIFQDVIIVMMIFFTPFLAGKTGNLGTFLLIYLAKGAGIIIFIIISTNWLVPFILYQVSRTRSRELFLLTVVALCLAIAWLTAALGLSLALGAFLAGLIISESEYSHQALSSIVPFKDVFTSFFFVSIGMLLDIQIVIQKPFLVLAAAVGVMAVKSLLAGFTITLLGFPFRAALLTALAVSQVGEFSFILSRYGIEHNLLSPGTYQLFLTVTVITMAVTPFVISASPRIADILARLPLPSKLVTGLFQAPGLEDTRRTRNLSDHLVIIGYGVNGRNVARVAKVAGIPHAIIEMNAETVREERTRGEKIIYGDAIYDEVLREVGIERARVAVVAISDPVATRRVSARVRALNPSVYLIVRTRYIREMEPLYSLGADQVIAQEFEASVEIFARVLKKYLVPLHDIETLIAEVRADGYEMLRSLQRDPLSFADFKVHIPSVDITSLRVDEDAPAVGRSLADLRLRKHHEVTLLAIQRGRDAITNPGGDTAIQAGDVLVLLGAAEKICLAAELFRTAAPPECR